MASGTAFLAIIFTAFSFHVIMFGIEVILSLIIFTKMLYAYKTGEEYFTKESKKFMNYIAVTYASSHFFLTATTVMLLSYFPEFLILAGQVLFWPLGFVLLILILRLSMIAYFWYGWGKVPKLPHLISGGVFALAGVIWVYLYANLLAFMNYAKGLVQVSPLKVDDGQIFLNPTMIPILLTLVFGAIAATTGFMIFIYGRRIVDRKQIVMPDSEYEYKLFQYYNYTNFVSLILFVASLTWYLVALHKYSYHKFSNLFGKIFGIEPASVDLGWLLIIFLLITVGTMVLSGWNSYRTLQCEYHDLLITPTNKWQFLSVGPLIGVLFEILILLNFISQTPYFVVSPLSEGVAGLEVPLSVNEYADVIDMYAVTVFGFVPLLLAFASLLYFVFTGRIGGDMEYHGKVASKL